VTFDDLCRTVHERFEEGARNLTGSVTGHALLSLAMDSLRSVSDALKDEAAIASLILSRPDFLTRSISGVANIRLALVTMVEEEVWKDLDRLMHAVLAARHEPGRLAGALAEALKRVNVDGHGRPFSEEFAERIAKDAIDPEEDGYAIQSIVDSLRARKDEFWRELQAAYDAFQAAAPQAAWTGAP